MSSDVNGTTRAQMPADGPALDNAVLETRDLDAAALDLVDRWWRAANYVSVGQIYLRSNPLLREPLTRGTHQIQAPWSLGDHTRTEFCLCPPEPGYPPGRQQMLFIAGPGHGGPAVVANAWLKARTRKSTASG